MYNKCNCVIPQFKKCKQPMTENETVHIDLWRALALRFHAVADLVAQGQLPRELEPAHLLGLLEQASVARFLLHLWSDREHHFDLAEVRDWDSQHVGALADWVSGETAGEPCRYFSAEPHRKESVMNPTVEDQHCELIPISAQVARYCASLRASDGSRVTPDELIESFLVCIEQLVARPGSWEASLGREFLEAHGYVVVHGWRGGI